MFQMKVYLDNAATTPVLPSVLTAMQPYFLTGYGNASALHSWGQQARKGIETARQQLADVLGAEPSEIVFTSCATESINLSHRGLVESLQASKCLSVPHIIISPIEHKAVLETVEHLRKRKEATVTILPVDKEGLVKVEEIEKAIRPETALVSIMYANNEVGTVEPIAEIGRLIKELNARRYSLNASRIYFHTDATQAIRYLDCRVDQLGVDMLSLTGHKFGAPKGIGALYVRKGTPLIRQQDGGGQEFHLRAGTENVPYIVGLGKAASLVSQVPVDKVRSLRDRLIAGVLKISGAGLTGHPQKRVPHIASFTIKGIEGEAMLLLLSDQGIAASSGSACTSGTLKPSHVLTAMGIPAEEAHGSLRLSLSLENTIEEIDYVSAVLLKIVERLRQMAPKL